MPRTRGVRHTKGDLWELPHWMLWLGGVLVEHGLTELDVLDLYSGAFDDRRLDRALGEHPADVYLFSPMTVNLPVAVKSPAR